MKRLLSTIVALAFSLLTPVTPVVAAETSATRKPNIIFILADDLGYGDLGCYGQKVIQTPNLDRMAAEGLRFTDCYAGSTVCAPSRSCLMTGQHTGHTPIRGNGGGPLRPADVTVAEVLKGAGYSTALVGKWGLGEEGTTGIPTLQGFDCFFGYLNQGHAHNYYPDFLWRNTERVPLGNEPKTPIGGSSAAAVRVSTKKVVYSHDLFAEEALKYVDEHKAGPFFLYLALTVPHANNEAGREVGDGMEVPDYGIYAEKDWPNQEKGRAAMITLMDRDVGRLFDLLDRLGIDRDTIVFFSSDNGPHKEGGSDPEFFHSSGPLKGIKRSLHDGGIRVPTIVRWPGKIEPGVSDFVWAFWDFLPTAADLAGVQSPKKIDGVSVLPVLLGEGRPASREFLYWEFHEGGSKQAVRMGNWKAVRPVGGPLQLYDLRTDLGETTDVAAEHPKIVSEIEEYLKTARSESADWPLKSVGAAKAKAAKGKKKAAK
ncbi:MAG: arylsulfatase [Planctomycetota bacterium]